MQKLLRATAIAVVLGLGLGGCLRPLYGTAEYGGLAVNEPLKGVKIELQGERLAHYLRNELEFNLRGGDPGPAPATYRLAIYAQQTTQTAIVDRITGFAETASMQIDAKFSLFANGKPAPLTEGDARVVVGYDRSQQRFASIRSARDAEITGARQMAEQIRTRVAAYLASQR
jgi:LPS-assembly lipoprotein